MIEQATSKNAERDFRFARSAFDRALIRHIAKLPDIAETAFHLTEREVLALASATRTRDGWRVRVDYQRELAAEGLCEVRGPHLTAFGMAVRLHIMRERAS